MQVEVASPQKAFIAVKITPLQVKWITVRKHARNDLQLSQAAEKKIQMSQNTKGWGI